MAASEFDVARLNQLPHVRELTDVALGTDKHITLKLTFPVDKGRVPAGVPKTKTAVSLPSNDAYVDIRRAIVHMPPGIFDRIDVAHGTTVMPHRQFALDLDPAGLIQAFQDLRAGIAGADAPRFTLFRRTNGDSIMTFKSARDHRRFAINSYVGNLDDNGFAKEILQQRAFIQNKSEELRNALLRSDGVYFTGRPGIAITDDLQIQRNFKEAAEHQEHAGNLWPKVLFKVFGDKQITPRPNHWDRLVVPSPDAAPRAATYNKDGQMEIGFSDHRIS